MPVISILVGIAVGLVVWGVLDQIQGRAIKKIAAKELEVRLDRRARESLTRFDQYLKNYAMTARLLANHRSLAEYLEPLFWSSQEAFEPVIYRKSSPSWLTDFIERNALSAPSHILLVDSRGRIREVYQSGDAELPRELGQGIGEKFTDTDELHTVVTRLDARPYLLVSDAVEDTGGYRMGDLIVVVPINDEFLAASQRGLSSGRAAVALVDVDEQRILASIDPSLLVPGTRLSEWRDTYLITTQSLPEYEGTDWNLLLATFISHQSVTKMSSRVRNFEQQQRVRAALVYILVFTLVIYLVSARLNKVLKRMAGFSQRALGIEHPGFKRGANQLMLLEEWIQHFTQLVLKAREEMSRRHESEMRASEALKAAIMEASLDPIVTLSRRGKVIELNPTAERTLALTRDQAIGASFSKLFLTLDGRRRFLGLLRDSRRARREGRIPQARGQLMARRAGGSELPVELSIVPIQLDDKFVYTVYMHDITKRREAEREIKSLARFAGESPNPILRVSPSGLVVYANAASSPLLAAWGTQKGGLLPAKQIEEVGEALRDGRSLEHETELGDQIYSLLFAPIQELGYVNIYARDITAVRRAEQESRRHQAELVHVCRLSTMGEVATGMAHELNQPLSAIVNFANGCSRRLHGSLGPRQELMDAMGQITTQAQRASEIIRRLRALVGKQPPIQSEVDLNHLVREVCSFVEFDTDQMGFAIELDPEPDGIAVDVDLVQIEQVLLNLVQNALDALQEVAPAARHLTVRTRLIGDEAEVVVQDSGPGIEPERMQSLFEPFFTTKASGMGMGLPISQTILKNHGGHIWAESVPRGGAVFFIRLPVAPSARQSLAAQG
ncbi:PAS domain-containing sensor histidine kinase [Candidatus Thiosymbion oneisti]|uniref:PAS domain-containing sensor histidine kinase n=1 Tax=Candidatus Thiosymbion oneisti TaxID=589554 RepID=UPI000A62BBFC|nr:ATP-binding protein [Candidatus Thiosymbion oneisti]